MLSKSMVRKIWLLILRKSNSLWYKIYKRRPIIYSENWRKRIRKMPKKSKVCRKKLDCWEYISNRRRVLSGISNLRFVHFILNCIVELDQPPKRRVCPSPLGNLLLNRIMLSRKHLLVIIHSKTMGNNCWKRCQGKNNSLRSYFSFNLKRSLSLSNASTRILRVNCIVLQLKKQPITMKI